MYDELACDYRLGKLKLHAGYSIFSLSVSCLIWNRNLVTLLTVCDSVESKIYLYMYVVFMRQVCLGIHMGFNIIFTFDTTTNTHAVFFILYCDYLSLSLLFN